MFLFRREAWVACSLLLWVSGMATRGASSSRPAQVKRKTAAECRSSACRNGGAMYDESTLCKAMRARTMYP